MATSRVTENADTTTTSMTTVAPSTSLVNGPAERFSEMTAIASGGESASMTVPARIAPASRTDVGSSDVTTKIVIPTTMGTAIDRPSTCATIGPQPRLDHLPHEVAARDEADERERDGRHAAGTPGSHPPPPARRRAPTQRTDREVHGQPRHVGAGKDLSYAVRRSAGREEKRVVDQLHAAGLRHDREPRAAGASTAETDRSVASRPGSNGSIRASDGG